LEKFDALVSFVYIGIFNERNYKIFKSERGFDFPEEFANYDIFYRYCKLALAKRVLVVNSHINPDVRSCASPVQLKLMSTAFPVVDVIYRFLDDILPIEKVDRIVDDAVVSEDLLTVGDKFKFTVDLIEELAQYGYILHIRTIFTLTCTSMDIPHHVGISSKFNGIIFSEVSSSFTPIVDKSMEGSSGLSKSSDYQEFSLGDTTKRMLSVSLKTTLQFDAKLVKLKEEDDIENSFSGSAYLFRKKIKRYCSILLDNRIVTFLLEIHKFLLGGGDDLSDFSKNASVVRKKDFLVKLSVIYLSINN